MRSHLIFYVAEQDRSTAFYTAVLGYGPSLYISGMTEFELSADTVLGLMPEEGICRLLAPALSGTSGDRTLRAELYLVVDDPGAYHLRALAAGAEELSPLRARDWGHAAAYSRDPDGYILGFACDLKGKPH